MMNEMVERVAKAIWDDACPGMSWGELDKLNYEGWARAAIEAMREPTPEMFTAAYEANGGKWIEDEYEPPPRACWAAMIDAALKKA